MTLWQSVTLCITSNVLLACGNNFQNERKRSHFFFTHTYKTAAIKYVHECWDERSENEKKKNKKKKTKKKTTTMKQRNNLPSLAHYPDSIEVNKVSFDHRVIITCMNIFAQQKLQVMIFFVLLQNDMTIEIYGHAANVSNNVFR